MGSTSTSTSSSAFTVRSQIELPGPKFSTYNVRKSPNSPFISLRKHYSPASASLLHSISKNSHFSTLNPPASKLSGSDSPSQRNLYKIFVERFVALLIGSFVFLGCFNVRYAMAFPAQRSSKIQTLDEKIDTLSGDSEEEMRERILEHDPRNIDTLRTVLYGKMRSGKAEEATEYVQRLIDLEPEEVEWRLLMALCYETMGQLDTAKGLFMEILEKNPLLVRALHGLALVMHKNKEGQSIFDMLNKARDIACYEKKVTEQRSIGILIAQMHVVKGELEEGLKKFQDLIEENPRDFRPYLCQGIIYSLLDKKREAAEQFETYRAIVPDEFPQKEFIDDVVLSATTASREQFEKEFAAEFSYKK